MGKREISTWHVAPGVMVPPDRGCSLASACLTCPLPASRHDAPLPQALRFRPQRAEHSDRNARVRRRVEELLEAGAQKSVAVRQVAAEDGTSIQTTWRRLEAAGGVTGQRPRRKRRPGFRPHVSGA